ncbi:MAG: ACT domain-containing protein [Oscillospiraceae bacterium]|jgi:chorismate mutase|nr:ACT domain-containing protein [Oscillospiraceae bacterium]
MTEKTEARYYLVQGDVLPDVFLKVVGARELLNTGEAKTVMEAVERMGISRSAFYKYKDSVLPFRDMTRGRIFTFNLFLRDEMGVLSGILAIFAEVGANILTINQNIPSGGVALVTIAARLDNASETPDQLLVRLKAGKGVVSAELLAG